MCKAELMRYPLKKKMKRMINYDEVPGENKQEQNPQSNNSATIQYKIFLYVKDPSERKYLLLITKNEDVGQRHYEPQGLH